MEKHEAVTYINQMLDQEQPREDIIRGLMEQLHAPEAMVSKFVAQIEAGYLRDKPQPLSLLVAPPPVTLPPWLEDITADTEADIYPPPTQTIVPEDNPAGVEVKKISDIKEATDFVTTEYANGRPQAEIVKELAMRTGEPFDLTQQFVALTISGQKTTPKVAPALKTTKAPSIELNKPENVRYVINELAKHRKRNDIVMTICERTGAQWNEAQRFVGQVHAEQHNAIHARMNRFIITLCFGTMIVGFLFTAGTILPLLYEVAGRAAEFELYFSPSKAWADYIKAAPYVFITGAALIIAGIFGYILAKQSQMD